MLNLTPEQQAIFDHVVGIVTQNSELRHQFKTANQELDKNPEGNELEYINDSENLDAVSFRAACAAVDAAILDVEPNLKITDSWFFDDISIVICKKFRDTKQETRNE